MREITVNDVHQGDELVLHTVIVNAEGKEEDRYAKPMVVDEDVHEEIRFWEGLKRIILTHRPVPRDMESCDLLHGIREQKDRVSQVLAAYFNHEALESDVREQLERLYALIDDYLMATSRQ